MPSSTWFAPPYDELQKIITCKKSGYRASEICEEKDTIWAPKSGLKTAPCPYHHWIHLDKTGSFQVNSSCEAISDMKHVSWFVLPPVQAYYYQLKNPFYKPLPPFRDDCVNSGKTPMEFIDNNKNEHIFLPKNFDEHKNNLILKIKHVQPEIQIYWYLDNRFIKSTKNFHEIAIQPKPGSHTITAMDALGNEIKKNFKIL